MKKKILTLALSSSLALGSVLPAFADTISQGSAKDKIYIETAIGFRYPETIEKLKEKDLKATLDKSDKKIEIALKDFLNNGIITQNIDNYAVTSQVIENEQGKVEQIKFKIEGLEAGQYTLSLTGKNYVKTVVNLDATTHSKRVNISTAVNMALGDVDNSGKIDDGDIKLLQDNLDTENSEYDLNGDGKITSADIAIVNSNKETTLKDVEVFDTEAVASKVAENLNVDAINKEASPIENGGSIKDIFDENKTVTFKPKEGEKDVVIPLEFNTPEEMSSIEVKIPEGAGPEDISLEITDDKGQKVQPNLEPKASPKAAMFSRSNETVVKVELGKRVAVKKVVVKVTPKQDGGVVVVDEVKFLKDVVSEDVVQDSTVKNVVAKAGDGEVRLSWRGIPNVTGYKIYYGTDKENLTQTTTTDTTEITISGLENLKVYYFVVAATNGEWEGDKSVAIKAMPESLKAPFKPDFVKASAGDGEINLSWKASENAESYNVYKKTSSDSQPVKVASNITSTNYKLKGLTNGTEYTLYVSAQNKVGESSLSEPVQATPEKEVIVPPTLPDNKRIPNSDIVKVEMGNELNYNEEEYPNGFDPKWLIDGNYNTHWVARKFWEPNSFAFTFKEPKTMDYLIWVPRLDKDYRRSFTAYDINVWLEGDDLSKEGRKIAERRSITTIGEDDKYFVFDFPKQEKVVKIQIRPIQWDGSPTNMNASEVAFYEYNDIADRIEGLFANSSRTALKSEVKEEDINKLLDEVNATNNFVVNKDILVRELEIAKSLLNNNNEALGVIKDNIYSINPEKDKAEKGIAINNWQPLGVVGRWKENVVIYADIPEGEEVYVVPTQFYEEADTLSSNPIKLKNGRNIITIPKIGNVNTDRGGSLYVTYSGAKAKDIKLQVVGAHKIPYLELHDLDKINKEEAEKRISEFIKELKAHVPTLQGNLTYQNLNACEISLPNVLLSLPANKILEGIEQGVSNDTEKVEKVYQTSLAFEELMDIMYKTRGIDESLETRNNIRYMKMFGGAFMYAAGNHIGIGYDSVAPLMNGKTVEVSKPTEANELFGWGIAHEIGHVLDTFGKAEITNNIYSLMAQTYDGKANTLKSRLELNNVYQKAFDKVSVGGEGVPNDVFVQLCMYWQLHLAYDNADAPLNFYNALNKLYRTDEELKALSGMDKFAVGASKVAQKDLSTFFERWGVRLSAEAKDKMNVYQDETRAIYYLNDESRRQRIDGNKGNTNIKVTATASVNPKNEKQVIISINPGDNKNVQGYEIIRNGKSIGFTTTNQYVDTIGSANNMAFTYEIIPVDVLGNLSTKQSAGQVRISYDNTIDKSKYTLDEKTNIATFTEPTIVTGIKVTPKQAQTQMPTGDYKVYAKIVSDTNTPQTKEDGYILAKSGNFSKNASDKQNVYIGYLNKPQSEEDKICAYDVTSIKLEGIDLSKYNVEFISYQGDNIEFLNMGIGRLKEDCFYGVTPEEVIKKGTLVIVGKYRGNSALSNIYVKGKFDTSSSLEENQNIVEREISGYSLMFDTLDKDGTITSSTSDGIFIFVPDIQAEAELQGVGYEDISVLPTEIMAEMWITDAQGNKQRKSSDTVWITMPSEESLPQIEIK